MPPRPSPAESPQPNRSQGDGKPYEVEEGFHLLRQKMFREGHGESPSLLLRRWNRPDRLQRRRFPRQISPLRFDHLYSGACASRPAVIAFAKRSESLSERISG